MDRSAQLGRGSIPRLLLTFSIPAIVGMLANALYNVVDRIIVGQALGSIGIAATTVAFPLMLILLAFGLLIGLGATALISIRLGQQNRPQAELVLGNALTLLVIVHLGIAVVGLFFLDPLLVAFGASKTVLPYARDYLQIILAGAVFQGLGFGLNHLIRGEGNPRIAMLTMLIGAVLNVILDAIFIFAFGWGMRGAALATVLSQAVSAVWVLAYFLRGRSLLRLRAGNLRLRLPICREIFVIGSPPFMLQLSASLLNTILNNQLRIHGGDLAISVMGIIYAVVMMIAMPVFGINQGSQPIIGYNYGAGQYHRVKWTLLRAVTAASGITTLGFLATVGVPGWIVLLFNRNDPQLAEMGRHAMRIATILMPIVGFQVVSANYFQAVGKPKEAMFLSLSRPVLLLIPALLILPYFFGLDGVWAAMPAADLGSSILTALWLFRELRHLNRKHADATATATETPLASIDGIGVP